MAGGVGCGVGVPLYQGVVYQGDGDVLRRGAAGQALLGAWQGNCRSVRFRCGITNRTRRRMIAPHQTSHDCTAPDVA